MELHSLCSRLGTATDRDANFEIGMDVRTKYRIEKANLGYFFSEYCRLLNDGAEDLSLAESPENVMPAIFRLNLRFDSTKFSDPYEDDFMIRLVYATQQTLIQNLQINENSDRLHCVVLESDPIKNEEKPEVNVTVVLHFPYIKCESLILKTTLRNHLIRRLRSSNVMSYLFDAIGNWDDILDLELYDKPVPMYGSKVSSREPQLEYLKTIRPLKEIDLDLDYTASEVELHTICNPDAHSYVSRRIIDKNIFAERREIYYWLPIILSLNYPLEETLPRRNSNNSHQIANAMNVNHDVKNFGKESDVIDYTKMEFIHIFLDMWKAERILTKEFWAYIGEALYDATDGDDEGNMVWRIVTERAIEKLGSVPEFLSLGVQDICDSHYYAFKLDRTTYRTLGEYAQIDNPEEYKKWHRNWCMKAIEVSSDGIDNNIARAFYRTFWLKAFSTFKGKKITWYIFYRNKLNISSSGYEMRRMLSKEFYNIILEMIANIAQQMRNLGPTEQDMSQNILVESGKTLAKLRRHGNKNAFMSEAAEFFAHPCIGSYLNNNPELIGMPNGILVANTEGISIREGRLEDYVTRSINVTYREDYHWNHPAVLAVTKWMRQMFPEQELNNHWRKMLASILRGGNNDKKFYAICGSKGNNSKSMWIKLIEAVLGPYCIKCPISLLTHSSRDANAASPATARFEGARIVIFEEADKNSPLKENVVKHITGYDKLYTRDMFSDGKEIDPHYKVWFVTNDPPPFEGSGGNAIRNRMEVIDCVSIWSDEAPETEEEQDLARVYKMNIFFEAEIPRMAPALFWIMFQYYPTYLKEGLRKTPRLSVEATQKYWIENDQYSQFTAERIEPAMIEIESEKGEKALVQDESASMDIETVCDTFQEWFGRTYPGRKTPDRPTIRKELALRWGDPDEGFWYGLRMKNSYFSNSISAAGPKNAKRGLFAF